jgi:hypothetical protein
VKVHYNVYDLTSLFRDYIFALLGIEDTIMVTSLSKRFNSMIQKSNFPFKDLVVAEYPKEKYSFLINSFLTDSKVSSLRDLKKLNDFSLFPSDKIS